MQLESMVVSEMGRLGVMMGSNTSVETGVHKLEMYYAPDKDIIPDTFYKIEERVTLIDNYNYHSYPYGGMP